MKKEGWNGKNPGGLLDYFPLFILGVLLGKGKRRTNKGDGISPGGQFFNRYIFQEAV